MILTAAKKYPITPQKRGGDFMKGSIHFHEPAKRWYVSLYWQGQRYRIWKYNGEPLWHQKTAEKLLSKIRAEVDSGTLNIKSYFPDSPLSLKSFSEQWIKAFPGAESTRKFYQKAMNKCIEYFGTDFDIRTFTHSKLQIFYNELNLSVKGKYNVLSALKTMLHYARNDELIAKVPPFPALPLGLPEEIRYLTHDQQRAVLEAIPERHRPVFEFAMEYGLRIGEVLALQKDCVTPTEIIIKRSISDGELRQTTKTGRSRVMGITTRGKDIIKRQTEYNSMNKTGVSPFLFTREDGKSYTWKSLTKRWKTACKHSGVSINLYNGIRHSLGGQLMDEGIDLEMVRDILGHTSTNMTRRYAKRASHIMTNILEFRGRSEDEKERAKK